MAFLEKQIAVSHFLVLGVVVQSLKIPNLNLVGPYNLRNNARVLDRLDNIGCLLCIKACQSVKVCDAVNYKKSTLQCELVAEEPQKMELVTSMGWRYIQNNIMQRIRNNFNNCGIDKQSIQLKSGRYQCLPFYALDYPVDCRHTTRSGVYNVSIDSTTSVRAMCQDGWMVFQRKAGSDVSFRKNWLDYKQGFGDVEGDHWLGNEYIHLYTSQGDCELKIELETSSGATFYALYNTFTLGSEENKYTLNVDEYSGTAGNSFYGYEDSNWESNKRPFTTVDQDNDLMEGNNCAGTEYVAWWYAYCSQSVLNKLRWYSLSVQGYEVTGTRMMTRRRS